MQHVSTKKALQITGEIDKSARRRTFFNRKYMEDLEY